MSRYHIAVLPGDGIGPEVMNAAIQVLNVAVSVPSELQLEFTEHPIGATHYKRSGQVLPDAVLQNCQEADAVLLSAMVAYVVARFPFPGNRLVFYFFMSGMLFPVFLALVPLFFLLNTLGMFGTFPGLILVYIAFSLPFTVFFLTGFFKTIPSELHEAAIIDGANQYQVFLKVMLPLAKSGLVSMAIFNFLGMWNQYILPLVLLSDSKKYVISQGLAALALEQKYQSDWSGLFAAIVLVMIPTLTVYILFQSQIQKGLTAGALKG